MRRVAGFGAALAAFLAPGVALACPVCAQRQDGGVLRTVALGALIVSPWIAAGAIGLWIRRIGNESPNELPNQLLSQEPSE